MKNISKLIAVLLVSVMLMVCAMPTMAVVIDIPIDISDLFETDGDNSDNNTVGGETYSPEIKDQTSGNNDSQKPQTNEQTDNKQETPEVKTNFIDVNENDWFYSYVTSLASKNIITGYPDGSFKPQGNITRAEFLKLLVECMGYEITSNQVFDDVTEDDKADWYFGYVSAAADHKVISVEDYGKELKPNDVIKRDEVASLIIKALGVETGKLYTLDDMIKTMDGIFDEAALEKNQDSYGGVPLRDPSVNDNTDIVFVAVVSSLIVLVLVVVLMKKKFLKVQ